MLLCLVVLAIVFPCTVQAATGPEGLVGIPWGASPDTVERVMAERHFPRDEEWRTDHFIYVGSFAGYPAYLSFHFENNKFVDGGAVLIEVFHSIDEGDYRGIVDRYFGELENQLTQKYGKPYRHNPPGDVPPWKPLDDHWNVKYQDDDIYINLSKTYAFKPGPRSEWRNFGEIKSRIAISYTNSTLQEKEKQRSKARDL